MVLYLLKNTCYVLYQVHFSFFVDYENLDYIKSFTFYYSMVYQQIAIIL